MFPPMNEDTIRGKIFFEVVSLRAELTFTIKLNIRGLAAVVIWVEA